MTSNSTESETESSQSESPESEEEEEESNSDDSSASENESENENETEDLHILGFNIRGLTQANLQNEKLQVIQRHLQQVGVIGETWLNQAHGDANVLLEGFEMIRFDRVGPRLRGGLLMYLREGIEHFNVAKVQLESRLQYIHVEIGAPHNIDLIGLYMPRTSIEVFKFIHFYASVLCNRRVVFIGDINADPNRREGLSFNQLPGGFRRVEYGVDDPTCYANPNNPSRVDHVITNIPSQTQVEVLRLDEVRRYVRRISDHVPISWNVPVENNRNAEPFSFPKLSEFVGGLLNINQWLTQKLNEGFQCKVVVWYRVHQMNQNHFEENLLRQFAMIGANDHVNRSLNNLPAGFEVPQNGSIVAKECIMVARQANFQYDLVFKSMYKFMAKYFICDNNDCFQLFVDRRSWQEHRRDDHGINLNTHFCENNFCRGLNFLHLEQAHVCFACEENKRQFVYYASQLHDHQFWHQKPRMFCERCGKLYKRRGPLNKHVMKCTKNNEYWCYICARAFVFESGLRNHQRSLCHFYQPLN